MKSVLMDGGKSGKFGKLENWENDEETISQGEERLCKSIIRGLVERNHEKHTMLADVEQKNKSEMSYASMTSPAGSCRGMQYVKLGKWNSSICVTSEGTRKSMRRKLSRNMESLQWTRSGRADLYAGTPPLEALKAVISIAANHKETFFNHTH